MLNYSGVSGLASDEDVELKFAGEIHASVSDDDEATEEDVSKGTYTVEEAVEKLGIGWFQFRLWGITGLFSVSFGQYFYYISERYSTEEIHFKVLNQFLKDTQKIWYINI